MVDYMEKETENNRLTTCLNCETLLPEKAAFCPQCGQKATDGLISLKEFVNNFLENVFNLDSRIVQTTKWLCIPAKLTKEYFKGKHRTYYHPIRLYLVMSLIFFAILSLKNDDDSMVNIDLGEKFVENAQKEKFRLNYQTTIDSISEQILLTNQHPKAKAALDSLKKRIPSVEERDSFNLTLNFGKEMKVDRLDVMTLETEDIIKKYEIEGFWNKILVKQGVHFLRDSKSFSQQVAGNFPLMLLLMMPALALFLKLLYIRRKRFFVEHLVLNFHHHAFAFFLFSIILIMPESSRDFLVPIGLLLVLASLFLAMKWYYGQGFGKTLIKYILFNGFYLIAVSYTHLTLPTTPYV